jgi:TonB family protein
MELQNKYNAAVQEITRLKEELDQARREIEQLQQHRESVTTPTPRDSPPVPEEQQYTEAIAALTTAIAANPQEATLYRNRGIAYTHVGKYEQALQDLHKAIKLDPQDAIAYNQRGIAYYQTGKYQLAIEDFSKAIERNAELAEAYQNRGIAWRKLGNYSQALQDLRKAAQSGLESASQYLQVLRNEVQYAQERLQKAGLDPGPADGLPGPQTLAALRAFQRTQNFPTTGLLDDATKQALGAQPSAPARSQSPPGEAPPQFVHQPKPEYPLLARQNGWEGTTTLRFELLADGTIGQVEIAKSSGYPILDTAAQEAIKQWTHKPAIRDGAPVTRWTTLQVNFTLDKTPDTGR